MKLKTANSNSAAVSLSSMPLISRIAVRVMPLSWIRRMACSMDSERAESCGRRKSHAVGQLQRAEASTLLERHGWGRGLGVLGLGGLRSAPVTLALP
jgi:hypothetical protein